MNRTLHIPNEPRFGQGSMITYVISRIGRALRETLALAIAPPQVTLTRTRYLVRLNGTIHHVRRDRACDCGGTPDAPCPAVPLIQDYLAAGGPRPLGRHQDTWPESWLIIPTLCPICDCPTIPDRCLDSSHGPGWRCSFDPSHHWLIRMNPLRRHLAAHPPPPTYPWYDASPTQRQAWLEAHCAPPRLQSDAPKAVALLPNEGEDHHALDRTTTSASGYWPDPEVSWLAFVWLSRGPVRRNDRLLRAGQLGRRGRKGWLRRRGGRVEGQQLCPVSQRRPPDAAPSARR